MTRASAGSSPALVEVAPEHWDALLERLGCADLYYLRDYFETACLLEPGRPVFLHLSADGGDVVFPAIVRDVPGSEARDATTPYGYGGPLAVGTDAPVERFYAEYDAWCRANGVVSTFLRFHPVFANQDYAPPHVHRDRLGETIDWRLDPGRDLFTGMHPKHRNKIRKARAAGLEAEIEPGPSDLSEFVELYEETMRRTHAGDFYFFPAEYWELLTTRLRSNVVLVNVRFPDELAAAALVLAAKPWLHYHLSGTTERGRRAAAANLAVFEAGAWGQGEGFREFHLGGGLGSRLDSLYEFKVRFDPDGRREAWSGKVVHDADAYRSLSGADVPEFEGFFPAYRRPAA